MSELQDLLNSIDSHCSVENRDGYSNLSIGRGEIMMQGLRAPICDESIRKTDEGLTHKKFC